MSPTTSRARTYPALHAAVAACKRCPRLVKHLDGHRERSPTHHNAPVACWGAAQPKLLIVGLAPGAAGANRTGRGFVGDASSQFLFRSLLATDFATSGDAASARLLAARLTNVVKCLPPANRPNAQEIGRCRSHLCAELAAFWSKRILQPRVVVALGGVAYAATRQALQQQFGFAGAKRRFVHGDCETLAPTLSLIASFHPSPLNTQTGRLSQAMLDQCFVAARERIDQTSGQSK